MTYCELFKSSGVSYESQDGGARPHRPSPEAPGGLLSAPPASPAAGEPRACAPRAAPPQHGGGRRLLLNDVKAPGGVTTAAGWRPLGTGAGESRGEKGGGGAGPGPGAPPACGAPGPCPQRGLPVARRAAARLPGLRSGFLSPLPVMRSAHRGAALPGSCCEAPVAGQALPCPCPWRGGCCHVVTLKGSEATRLLPALRTARPEPCAGVAPCCGAGFRL